MLSRREDSDFWVENREPETVPERLRELLELWAHRPPSRLDFWEFEEVFPTASYLYVLYGMGFQANNRKAEDDVAERFVRETAGLTQRYLGGLPSNRELLQQIASRGLPRI